MTIEKLNELKKATENYIVDTIESLSDDFKDEKCHIGEVEIYFKCPMCFYDVKRKDYGWHCNIQIKLNNN